MLYSGSLTLVLFCLLATWLLGNSIYLIVS